MTEQTKMMARRRVESMTDLQFNVRAEMTLQELGTTFVRSGFFRDISDASQAVVKVLAGKELGLEPMAAMRGLHCFDGQVVLHYVTMISLIKASGKYRFHITKSSATGCILAWEEKDPDSGEWLKLAPTQFVEEDAQRAGLLNKDNWRKYPQDMYLARAVAQGWRRHCADLSHGPIYTMDEISEMPSTKGQSAAAADLEVALSTTAPTPAQQATVDAEFTESEEEKRETPEGSSAAKDTAGESVPDDRPTGPPPTTNSPSPSATAHDEAPSLVWPDGGPGGAEAAPPGPAVNVLDFQSLCAAYKAYLGEQRYHEMLQPFGGKSNTVRPKQFGPALEALHGACQTDGGPTFPAAGNLRKALSISKPELQEAIPSMEGKCSVGTTMRTAYLGDAGLEKALVIALRVYYARLLEMYADVQEMSA